MNRTRFRQLQPSVDYVRRSMKRGSVAMRHLLRDGVGAYNGPGSFEVKLAAVRGYRCSQRARGGRIEPSDPGTMLLRFEPDAILKLSRRLTAGTVLVSATNGKTTTAAMVARILERAGHVPVHNHVGLNMANGLATELVAASRIGGRIKGDIGVFEVDELWLQRLVPQLRPSAIVLGNRSRDQLDRYGELDAIAHQWERLVDQLDTRCRLVACADDPRVSVVAARRPSVVYFGIDDPSLARSSMQHASDSIPCGSCGETYTYDAVYLAHLGEYRCPRCRGRRPPLDLAARGVRINGMEGSEFTLWRGSEHVSVRLRLPGLFNVYNALAAAGISSAVGVGLPEIAAGLNIAEAAFGRSEIITVQGISVHFLLIKNPAGANAVLETLLRPEGPPIDLLVGLNDTGIDGRDVSWVWDADFEHLAEHIRHVVCTGSRATELALRFKYAGVEETRLLVEPHIGAGLDLALSAAHDLASSKIVYALPNYTAMLELREVLADRGVVDRYWT